MSAERGEESQSTTEYAVPEPGSASEGVLHRPVSLMFAGRATLIISVAFLAAILLRVIRLDAYVLDSNEASWSFDAWSLYRGHPLPGTETLPETSPFFLIIEALSFFIFGVTDAIARFAPALFGIGIVALVIAIRPFVSRGALIGMALLAAVSPTFVFASRTVDPAIAIAFNSLLLVVALMRAAHADPHSTRRGWVVLAGIGTAATLASGPEGVTSLIAIGIGFIAASTIEKRVDSAARAGIGLLGRSIGDLAIFLLAFFFALIVLFTRLFSNIGALGGILTTFADWGRMMAWQSTALPQSFFMYVLLLYEILAVVFAIVAVVTKPAASVRHTRQLGTTLFSIWFIVALILHSFASGRETEQAVLVAMPLVLLGGMGLGQVIDRVNWRGFWTSRSGLLPLAVFGLFVGVIAFAMAIARSNDSEVPSAQQWSPFLQITFVVIVVIVPMIYLIWTNASDRIGMRELGVSALLVLAILLGLLTIRNTTTLAYYRADDGNELLARNIPTQGMRQFVAQVDRLSRDLSVDNMSNVDNTGTHGLHIAISPDVEWPFAWYFRDYQNLHVIGPAGWNDSDDIVIAPTSEGMDTAGFVVQQRAFENRTANAHVDLNASVIFDDIFSPDKWYESIRYALFREMESEQPPATISAGYAFRVSNKINPNLGPFDLFTKNTPGPGSGLGQLSSPTDLAVSPDGQVIYVVNAGNERIERYARDGTFISVWDATNDPGLSLAFSNGQGASGITLSDDGLVYLADTWNHIVVVLDQEGRVVRQLGQRGVLTDIGDGEDPASEPGLFFGPRGIALLEDEIYVTDTGNERVQVFGTDGTFLRAFGGYGSEPGQLLEPTGIVTGPDGNIWVADSGNGRVSVFTPRGDFVRDIPVESWQDQDSTDRVNYMAFDQNGVLYLTAPARGELDAYDGNNIVRIGNANVVQPVGVAVSPDGMLLVTDGAESEVVQFVPKLPDDFGPQTSPAASPISSPRATPAT